MGVVGVIIPWGYTHVPHEDPEATIYGIPVQLTRPSLSFPTLPDPEELPSYFDQIAEDVKKNYEHGRIVRERGTDLILTALVHVSFVEMRFYAGLAPGAQYQVWHRMLRMTQGKCLGRYQFDARQAMQF